MYLSDEMDSVISARNEAIAESIIEGLSSQNVTAGEAQDILYRAGDILRRKKDSQAILQLLKNLK